MKTLKLLLILTIIALNIFTIQSQEKKVLMHYMLWYGDSIPENNDSIRHWNDGHADTALIGRYDSKSWSLISYHILLSYSCGIDGLVANVKDDYDEKSLDVLVSTINKLSEIDPDNFKYKFAISYDDQGMDNIETAKAKFIKLRDNILPNTSNYFTYNDTVIVFIYNYDGQYLSAQNYKTALEEVFTGKIPWLCWNESQDEVMGYVDVCYPWVQAYAQNWDRDHGLEWGGKYLDDFFWRINNIPQQHNSALRLACSAVWPGFDDRPNTSWGQNRWMDRQNGSVYDSTWLKTINYNQALPLKWVYIETWNDWNEGTEIEPGIEYGYQYLDSTIQNINRFKSSAIAPDDNRYPAARKIYEAGWLIEHHKRDSLICYPILKNAIRRFLSNDFTESVKSSDSIINHICSIEITELYSISNSIKTYPNPADQLLKIEIDNTEINGAFCLKLINTEGKEILRNKLNKNSSNYEYHLCVKGIKPGIYCLIITNGKYKGQQKVIIQ